VRTSILQVMILRELQARPGQSVTGIASSLDCFRSSVSRSLHTLSRRGLVTWEDQQWRSTTAGVVEAERATESLRRTATRVGRSFAAVAPNVQVLAESLDVMGPQMDVLASARRAVAIQNQETIRAIVAPADAARRVMADHMNEIANSVLVPLQGSLASLVRAQAANAELIDAAVKQVFDATRFSFIREWSRHLASAVDDAFAIHEAARLSSGGLQPLLVSDLVLSHFLELTSSLTSLNKEAAAQLVSQDHGSIVAAFPALLSPSWTVSNFSLALRLTATDDDSSTFVAESDSIEDPRDLRGRLARLEPRFAEMHRGAWDTLHEGGPDRLRQAAVSMRELLQAVLRHLVPDVELDPDNPKNLKARLRHVLTCSNSGSQYVTHQALALEAAYRQYNAYVHEDKRHAQPLRALFLSTDGLLLYVLVTASDSEQAR